MLMYMYLYFYLYTGNSQKSQNRNQDRVDYSHVSFYMNYNSFSKESEENISIGYLLIILKNNPNIGQLSANMTKVFQNIIVHEFHTYQLYISTNKKIFRHGIDGFVQQVHVLEILLHKSCLYTCIWVDVCICTNQR